MAVMLRKILILLAGQPNETSSYLADVKSEKKKKRVGVYVCVCVVRGGYPLLKCQDVINSYKVSTEDFNLCLCQDKDFTLFGSFSLSPSSSASSPPLPVTALNVLPTLGHAACYIVSVLFLTAFQVFLSTRWHEI